MDEKRIKQAADYLDAQGYIVLPKSDVNYAEDYLIASQKNMNFTLEPKFAESYEMGFKTDSWNGKHLQWRIHIICWAANHAKSLDGDFVECGVNKGGFSLAAMNYIGFENLDKTFYLMDTFKGLEPSQLTSVEEAKGFVNYNILYNECYEEVKKTFSNYSNVEIIRGVIPDTLKEVTTEKVAFMSIDMNCVTPEIAAIEYFWDKIVSGGIVILDDYGWCSHEEQKKAFDKFALENNFTILNLPTGQGLILKK